MKTPPRKTLATTYVFILLFGASLITGGPTSAQTPGFAAPLSQQGDFLQDIPYGPYPAETLDICRPVGGGHAHPGIIMIHGGAWAHGDKSQMDDFCRRFAQSGFIVANIDYRLASPIAPTPDWPNFQIADVQLAIRWMRSQAGALSLDTSRICAYGTSAGGYLAVFAAVLPKILPGDLAAISPNVPVSLSCVADGFGPVDLENPDFLTKVFARLIGYAYAENPTVYRNDSPLFYVTPRAPPMLVIHGTADTMVPIAQSEALVATLKRNGVTAQLITYQGNHAYQGLDENGLDRISQQITQFFQTQIGN